MCDTNSQQILCTEGVVLRLSSVINNAQFTSHALPILASHLLHKLRPQELAVLYNRSYHTLQDIANQLRLTRERVRQIETRTEERLRLITLELMPSVVEVWRAKLRSSGASEEELFAQYRDENADTPTQNRLGVMILKACFPDCRAPIIFGNKLTGWWTTDPNKLAKEIEGIIRLCPADEDIICAFVSQLEISPTIPVYQLLTTTGSAVRFHAGARGWVRRSAAHRDAAYILLQRGGESWTTRDLAKVIGLNPRALAENLRRDPRFRHLRPNGDWVLAEWSHLDDAGHLTTLEAVKAVLRDLGPLPLTTLTRQVETRYPVSPSAVSQCLSSEALGRWSDGRIDLAERGAPPALMDGKPPRRPTSVVHNAANSMIQFTTPVNKNLLRGSGVPIPRYVTWNLGMRQAPSVRTFSLAGCPDRNIAVRFNVHSSSVSSLRSIAEHLGAALGCILAIKIEIELGEAELWLDCSDHVHIPNSQI